MTFSANPTSAQYYVTGQDRGSIHWKEIETARFRLVFPDFLEWKAIQIATFCDTFAAYNQNELGLHLNKRQSKTPIIIHPSGSYSNGLSAWAPKRIEFWSCPQQNGYSQPWLQQLVLHEFRHELQMQAINQNNVGVLTSIFGEHFSGAVAGLFVPEWYLEGDATWAETVLSPAGRGRQSSFLTPAQVLLSEKSPSYYQSAFGSYKDYTMGSYLAGYLLVGHDKTTFDTANFWQNGLKRVSTDFWRLSSSYRCMQFKARYDSAMAFWKEYWQPFNSASKQESEKTITAPQRHYTDYHLAGITDTSVLALKRGNRCSPSLVEIKNNGKERALLKTGSVYDNYLTFKDSRIAWTEYARHSRWNLYYTNLVVYDISTDKRKILTTKRHIFSPSFSDDGQIVALETNDSNTWRLVFFDSTLAETTLHIPLPDSLEYQHPAFSATGDSVFVSATGNCGRYILLISNIFSDINENIDLVAGPFWHNIRRLSVHDGKLFAISDQSGVDRVVRFDDGKETTLSNNRFGIEEFAPSHDDKMLTYSRFTTNGYSIFSDTLDICKRQLVYNFNSEVLAAPATKYAIPRGIGSSDTTAIISKDYSHWKHLFNFHSWAPLAIDINDAKLDLGVTAMSQNELSNSILQSTFLWDYNNMKPALALNYQYLRYYPIISLASSFSGQRLKTKDTYYDYNLLSTAVGVSVPFRYYRHNHTFGMSLSGNYGFSQMFFHNPSISIQPYAHLFAATAAFTHSTAKPLQYIYTPWSQSLSVTAGYGIGNLDDIHKIAIAASLNFPSPIPTHTLRLYAGIQNRTKTLFSFSNALKTPRGFRHLNPNDIATSLQFNYDLPICYPDKAWGPVVYFKRIYATFFCDGMLQYDTDTFEKSFGAEIQFNGNLFMITTPVTFGVRASYLPDSRTAALDVLFSIDV